MQYAYAFIVGYNEDGVYVDSFLDVSPALGTTYEAFVGGISAAKRMGLSGDDLEQLLRNMNGIRMRAQITQRDLYKLVVDDPMTIEQLDVVLKRMQANHTLKKFLKEAKV